MQQFVAAAPDRYVVADSGFRPGPNGFTFQNYGDTLSDGAVPTNLTPADVQTLFGNVVCADAAIGKCDLIPEAQAWMDQTNQEMAGGHCFGFSVAADLVWQNKLNTSTFGAPTINGLAIDNNASLQSTIADGWVYQTLDSVQAKKITGTPNQILDELKKLLKPHPSETYTIAIWKRDGTGGHAVTPYEVKYKGDGQYEVLIYDNNWPGQTRAIAFDTNNDTWSYDAATNPSDPTEHLRGGRRHQDPLAVPDLTRAGHPTVPVLRHGAQRRGPPRARPERRAPRRSTSRAASPTTPTSWSLTTPGTASATSTASWSTRSPVPTTCC